MDQSSHRQLSSLQKISEVSKDSNLSLMQLTNYITSQQKPKQKKQSLTKTPVSQQSIKQLKRPQTSRNKYSKQSLAKLAQSTSSHLIASVNNLIHNKFPGDTQILDETDQRQIQNYFQQKALEFNAILQNQYKRPESSNQSKTQQANKAKEKKREAIRLRNQYLELERKKKSYSIQQENKHALILKKIRTHKRLLNKEVKIQQKKRLRQSKKRNSKEKQDILDNIKNYYRDKISQLKEALEQERLANKRKSYQQRQLMCEIKKEGKMKRKQHLAEASAHLDVEDQQFQMLLEENSEMIEKRLFQKYKAIRLLK